MEDKLLWWGYRHVSGTAHIKRYFDYEDIIEARESPFCDTIVGPFWAIDMDEALLKLNEKLERV